MDPQTILDEAIIKYRKISHFVLYFYCYYDSHIYLPLTNTLARTSRTKFRNCRQALYRENQVQFPVVNIMVAAAKLGYKAAIIIVCYEDARIS